MLRIHRQHLDNIAKKLCRRRQTLYESNMLIAYIQKCPKNKGQKFLFHHNPKREKQYSNSLPIEYLQCFYSSLSV